MQRTARVAALILGLLFSFTAARTGWAQVPAKFSYQGLLLNERGVLAEDGAYRVTFRLYADERGGEPLWRETQEVAVSDGFFTTFIGDVEQLGLAFDKPYFLSVQVDGEAESERTPLSAVPYSFVARDVAPGAVVRSLSGLKDEVEIVAGEGIEISKDENRLVISARVGLGRTLPGPRPSGVPALAEPDEEEEENVVYAPMGAGGSNTGLDAAYDAGRTITTDAGAVQIVGTGGVSLHALNGDMLFEDNAGGNPLFRFRTGGGGNPTQEWRFQMSNGNLLIRNFTGSTTPLRVEKTAIAALLQLAGAEVQLAPTASLRIPNGAAAGRVLTSDANGVASWQVPSGGGGGGDGFSLDASDGSPTDVVFVNASGNVGIGTTTPAAKLDVVNAGATPILRGFGSNGGTPEFTFENDGRLRFFNAGGTAVITLDADVSGDGRITTEELQITGGSDLSENFDVNPGFGIDVPLPGMVVSIDPNDAGRLTISGQAYDRLVAGIVSGAGGIETGLLMGQQDAPEADGAFPVALTGRVYAYVDAAYGAVTPGDLLTTSPTPGHAMKVDDYQKAQGAVIGKAMTALPEGRGLVLVLVSLQ